MLGHRASALISSLVGKERIGGRQEARRWVGVSELQSIECSGGGGQDRPGRERDACATLNRHALGTARTNVSFNLG